MDENPGVEQLLACLDVLWEELQERISYGEGTGEDECDDSGVELTTALWQTIELVYAMAQELEYVYRLVEDYTSESAKQRDRVQSVIASLVGPDGRTLIP